MSTSKCSVWGFLLCRKNGIEKVYLYVLCLKLCQVTMFHSSTGKTSEVLSAYGKLLLSWVGGMPSNSKPLLWCLWGRN